MCSIRVYEFYGNRLYSTAPHFYIMMVCDVSVGSVCVLVFVHFHIVFVGVLNARGGLCVSCFMLPRV